MRWGGAAGAGRGGRTRHQHAAQRLLCFGITPRLGNSKQLRRTHLRQEPAAETDGKHIVGRKVVQHAAAAGERPCRRRCCEQQAAEPLPRSPAAAASGQQAADVESRSKGGRE